MIQAVSSSNIQPNKASTPLRKESFKGTNAPGERKSTLADKASWTGIQFAKGAMISVIWDTIVNGIKLVSKNGKTSGVSEMARNAGTFGLLWIAAGLIIEGFDKASQKRRNG